MTVALDTANAQRDSAPASARRHRLLLRFLILNMSAIALLIAIYFRGWIDQVVASDRSYLSIVISMVFVFGWVVALNKTLRINRDLNDMDRGRASKGSWAAVYLDEIAGKGDGSRAIAGANLRLQMATWIAVVRHIANALVLLGLIGTVIGFVIALSGVDPNSAGDAASIAPMVAQLISGMSVALYTTLVGAVLNMWLMANFHLLNGGLVRLATGVVAMGESHARP